MSDLICRQDAIRAINGLQEVTEKTKVNWIPVSDRMPKTYHEVLVSYVNIIEGASPKYFVTFDTFLGDEWAKEPAFSWLKIIAWAEKPKPYTGEEE